MKRKKRRLSGKNSEKTGTQDRDGKKNAQKRKMHKKKKKKQFQKVLAILRNEGYNTPVFRMETGLFVCAIRLAGGMKAPEVKTKL